MKRISVLTIIALVFSTSILAQESMDSVTTKGSTEDVYYNFNTGKKVAVDQDNWDLAFENLGFTASVLINDQKGVMLYTAPYDVEEWTQFDTAGYMSWKETINSSSSWSSGAFNQDLQSETDLGWGTYNVQTHVISGDSVYMLKLADGSFKKMYIKDLTGGTYTFVYANIDGSSEMTAMVTKKDMNGQNFGYYSVEDQKVVPREPDTKEWDVVFTQYVIPVPTGPGSFQNYPVSGVKINKAMEVAQRDGIDVMSDDTTNLTWTTNISEIGSDWKTWDGTQYVYAQDRAYFVRLTNGAVWKMYFTKYEGGPLGTYHFVKEKIASGVNVQNVLNASSSIYPNPSNGGAVTVSLSNQFELKGITVLSSAMNTVATSTSNTINTAELASGMYFVQIETNQGTAIKKLLID